MILAGAAGAATAQDGPSAVLSQAQGAERAFALAEAERLYAEVAGSWPSSREARRGRVRLEYLRERRDPAQGYAPLEALERARREPMDRAGAAAFAERVAAMPDGRVKREAQFLLGETWLRRLDDPARALRSYEALIAVPGITPEERELAGFARAEAIAAAGDRAGAIRAMEDAGLGASFEADELRMEQTRSRLRAAAIALAALALAVLVAAGRPWRAGTAGLRRAVSLRRVLVLLYAIGVPAAIAELYERGTAETFLLFGALAAPVLLLASLAAESLATRPTARSARALALASAALAPAALAYLVLDAVGGLASFGL